MQRKAAKAGHVTESPRLLRMSSQAQRCAMPMGQNPSWSQTNSRADMQKRIDNKWYFLSEETQSSISEQLSYTITYKTTIIDLHLAYGTSENLPTWQCSRRFRTCLMAIGHQ
eukprot:2736319-Pleurochrysis_carterae.AAC.1